MMQFVDELLCFAMQMADRAAEISSRYFRQNLPVDIKPGDFPVTRADLEIESQLRQMIRANYPDHTIIGEEYAVHKGHADTYAWVIDPIDGTVAFSTGKPTFTTLIALTLAGKPVLGVIDQAITKERFIGISGKGAYSSIPVNSGAVFSTDDMSGYQQLFTTKVHQLSLARLNATTPDMFTVKEIDKFYQLRQQVRICGWGGDAYAYAMLASGHIDIILESQLQYYDVAALIPIIEGSGGIITTWSGTPLNQDFKGQCLAAANKELHEQALQIINT